VRVHQKDPKVVAAAAKHSTPAPVSQAVSYQFKPFFFYMGDKDVHDQHKDKGVKCTACHDNADEKTILPADLRLRCLNWHGLGPGSNRRQRQSSSDASRARAAPGACAACGTKSRRPPASASTDRFEFMRGLRHVRPGLPVQCARNGKRKGGSGPPWRLHGIRGM